MGAAKFQQTMRSNPISLTTGHSNYTGASSTDGMAGAATGTIHERICVASRGTSIANSLRVFKNSNGTKTFLFEVPIPARTPILGALPAWATVITTGRYLADVNTKLTYLLDQTDTGIDITEEGWDF